MERNEMKQVFTLWRLVEDWVSGQWWRNLPDACDADQEAMHTRIKPYKR